MSIASSLLAAGPSTAADQIVLRDLTILSDRRVDRFSDDEIRLDNGQILTWDQIEKAQIAGDQKKFDQFLEELGTPLYRIRQRLTVGDYQALLRHAEALYPRFAQRRSKTAYMVAQAVMWGRLASGQRALAVEPYLRCNQMLGAAGNQSMEIPGKRRLQFDAQTGLCKEFLPLWFDRGTAAEALKQVTAFLEQTPDACPAAGLYQTGLKLTLSDPQATSQMANFSGNHRIADQLAAIYRLQQEVLAGQGGVAVIAIETSLRQLDASLRPLAFYWLGRAYLLKKTPDEQRQGLLFLLKIPALYQKTFPHVAAAGLAHAAHTLHDSGNQRASIALRRELVSRYPGSWHAVRQTRVTDAETQPEKSNDD